MQSTSVLDMSCRGPWRLLMISATTERDLEASTDRMLARVGGPAGANLAEPGRGVRGLYPHRRALVFRDALDAAEALLARDSHRVLRGVCPRTRSVAFLFPGVGDQYPDMALELYRFEPRFRMTVDHCAERLEPLVGLDLRDELFPGLRDDSSRPEASAGGGVDLRRMLGRAEPPGSRLYETGLAQPAVFVIEYALARLLTGWGIVPDAMLGHSIGEYVAACVAGVFELDEALELVVERARLIESLPAGAMLAVMLPEREVRSLLGAELSLAAVNAPDVCVVSGPVRAICDLEERFAHREVLCRRLPASHAFHSRALRPIAKPLAHRVRRMTRRAPSLPYVSNVTGTWVKSAQATDPAYWAEHACAPVRFSDGIGALCGDPDRVLLEVGPGRSLSSFALQHPRGNGRGPAEVLSTTPSAYDDQSAAVFLLTTLARLWLAGFPLDADRFGPGSGLAESGFRPVAAEAAP